jgi:hypothetical protein
MCFSYDILKPIHLLRDSLSKTIGLLLVVEGSSVKYIVRKPIVPQTTPTPNELPRIIALSYENIRD